LCSNVYKNIIVKLKNDMNKHFFFIVMTALFAAVFTSCDKDEVTKKTSAEVQKETILTALNKNSDLSEFSAVLNLLYLADIDVAGLTVFAVKNDGMNKSALKVTDDGLNLKRHIVAGKYLKSLLINGQKLVALDGTILTITIMGDRVYVNGVELGDEIQAGNSIVYIVGKAIPTSANTAQYSFIVYTCNAAWSPDNPIPYHATANATVSLRDELGRGLGSYTTDNDGKLTLILVEGDYSYQVTKGNASNISKEGFLIVGIFTSQEEIYNSPFQPQAVLGGLKFADINWDGIINNADKHADGYVWLQSSQNVYIATTDFAPTYKP